MFTRRQVWPEATLLEARLKTGRTHQIRVHLAHEKFPIAGDDKYGDFEWNRQLARNGLKRMFLHAALLAFTHPATGQPVRLEAPLPRDLRAVDQLDAAEKIRVNDATADRTGLGRHAVGLGGRHRPRSSAPAVTVCRFPTKRLPGGSASACTTPCATLHRRSERTIPSSRALSCALPRSGR